MKSLALSALMQWPARWIVWSKSGGTPAFHHAPNSPLQQDPTAICFSNSHPLIVILSTDSLRPASIMGPSTSTRRPHDDSSPTSSRTVADEEAVDESHQTPSQKELEIHRKRARDRKSQQAMRDRTKWTINTLSEQVTVLSSALDQRARDMQCLETKVGFLETENAQLRTQNAALQLSLMGRNDTDSANDVASLIGQSPAGSSTSLALPPWELYPKNKPASCLADQILQGFVDTVRANGMPVSSPGEKAKKFPLKPNLCSLMDKEHRSDDDISNVVADVLRTYEEIESLPKQVAVFYVMATLLKVSTREIAAERRW